MSTALLFSCEHGGNLVPAAYRQLFASRQAQAALRSHRGYDIGALTLARALARHFDAPLLYAKVSRLLVELNRSLRHKQLFSQFSAPLERSDRQALLDLHYRPYRRRVSQTVSQLLAAGGPQARVLHISVHSFTPRLNGTTRNAEVGLLYDPRRAAERQLCEQWQAQIEQVAPQLRVRRNYPYLGRHDGLTTSLRREFRAEEYLGIELEANQALLAEGSPDARSTAAAIRKSLRLLLAVDVA